MPGFETLVNDFAEYNKDFTRIYNAYYELQKVRQKSTFPKDDVAQTNTEISQVLSRNW